MNVATLLHRAAQRWPDHTAIAHGDTPVASYAELSDRTARLATSLRTAYGLQPGDAVAVCMPNHPAYLEVLVAVWHAGLVAVPINAKLHSREVAWILAHASVAVCFVDATAHETIRPLVEQNASLRAVVSIDADAHATLTKASSMPPEEVDPAALAWLFYTSGTTGRPKGAMLSHHNLLQMVVAYLADVDTIAPGDSIVHAAPMSHGSGLYALPHLARGAVHVIPRSRSFHPAELPALWRRWPGATMFLAPTMVHRLIREPTVPDDPAGLKTIVYGGGPMFLDDLHRAMTRLGTRLVQIYGQGEAPMTITVLGRDDHDPEQEDRLASVGVPFTGVEVRVVDEQDRPVAVGEVGEVCCRGDVVMSGYLRDPAATEAALRGGWLHTGDLGRLDAHGYLTLQGRARDLVISGGTNIYPREVEDVLLVHPSVAEAAVVGRPHAEWGEEVVAFVVAADGASIDPQELDAWCLDRMARFKRPRHYEVVDGLPKNAYGKVLKTQLRERVGGR